MQLPHYTRGKAQLALHRGQIRVVDFFDDVDGNRNVKRRVGDALLGGLGR